jgi:hypothetical protein
MEARIEEIEKSIQTEAEEKLPSKQDFVFCVLIHNSSFLPQSLCFMQARN